MCAIIDLGESRQSVARITPYYTVLVKSFTSNGLDTIVAMTATAALLASLDAISHETTRMLLAADDPSHPGRGIGGS